MEPALKHLAAHFEDHVKDVQAFVRIPTVSAQPDHAEDVRRGAAWLMDRLAAAGMENIALVETSGHPAVVCDWLHAGDAPTVLVYGHYDVQPAAKEDGWSRDPFGAEVDGDRMWGRGTTDDKGQLLCHVFAAEAWIKSGGLPVNLKMVFEGEEEEGSVHFGEVLDKAADRLAADVLLVSDSPMRGENEPALTYSLRGLCYMQVDVQGPGTDLHSGTYGGAFWNPIEALAHMLASCKDPSTGRILIPGFYDGVVEPSDAERAALNAAAEEAEDVRHAAGAKSFFGEAGWTTAERIGIRPTFEINGFWGGYTGDGAKTVIPKAAHAKISCRLVANQEPRQICRLVEDHLRLVAPEGIAVHVTHLAPGDAVRTDPDHPAMKAVGKALADTFGQAPAALAEGGSIPAVADMQKRLGVAPILAGFGHRDENMHAPEESFRLVNLRRGREACARIYAALAR